MASNHGGSLSLFCCLLLLASIARVSSSGRGGGSIVGGSNSVDKVSVEVYYETLCPDSVSFILQQLPPLFHSGLIDIVDLKLYPWGNAKIKGDDSVSCQHGPYECLLNTIQACAIAAWPSLEGHFPFIYCVEKLVDERKYLNWETCFDKLGLDAKPVTDCYASGYGEKLELKIAALTDSLEPPHKYVPWVVVDGQTIYEDYENLNSYICASYKGPMPSACVKLAGNVLKQTTDHTHPVSYTDTTAKVEPSRSIPSSIKSWARWVIDRAAM